MIFPNWSAIEQISRERNHQQKSRPVSSPATRIALRSKLPIIITVFVLLTFTLFYLGSIHSAGLPMQIVPKPIASTSSTVYVDPAGISGIVVGSTFTVQVKVVNMAQFNGWDIQVVANPAVVNAVTLSITGNDFAVNASSGSAFEIVHCVNGTGTGCTSSDGAGIVHSAYGNTAILTGNGLLFSITYQVTGGGLYSYSPLQLQNDLISSPSSGSGVAHNSFSGSFGIQFGGGGGRHLVE